MLALNEAPKKDITVQGLIFEARLPYHEGHELNDREAGALNQTWVENLRNNYATKIKKLCEENKVENAADLPEEIRKGLTDGFFSYMEGYDFGVGGGREVDPVKSQAMQLAIGAVKALLKERKMSISEVGNEKIKSMAESAIENNPKFMERAAQIVADRQAAAAELMADLE